MAIGIGFGFSVIDFNVVATLLRLFKEQPETGYAVICAAVGLGRSKVEGYNNMLRHFKLTERRRLTSLGEVIHEYDEQITDLGTLCVLHYQVCSNRDAEIWHYAGNSFVQQHQQFGRADLQNALENEGIGSNHKPNHITRDVSLFLNAYTSEDSRALQKLRYIQKVGNGDAYRIRSIDQVPPLVVGYVLYDQRCRGVGASTLSIDSMLHMDGHVGRVFLLDRSQLMDKLRQLEATGWISISQIADLNNVTFNSVEDPLDLLKAYYSQRAGK